VEVEPRLRPVNFSSKVVVYIDSSKRRHRSTVYYEPRYTATGFGETRYVLPPTGQSIFVSALKSGSSSDRRYRTSVTFLPKLYQHTMTYSFHMTNGHVPDYDDVEDDSDPYTDSYSSSIHVQDADSYCERYDRSKNILLRRSSADNFLCDGSFSIFSHEAPMRDSGYDGRYVPHEEEMVVL
jgi:hypothetical protein